MEEAQVFWQQLLTIKEVFVYKIPPLATAAGHRAEEWGLADPLFTGSLKMAQNDLKLRIELFTPDGDEFGTCPIQVNPKEEGGLLRFVESVVDSSRYFVLRLVDKSNDKRSAMIGIGFRERDAAFDFKNVMNEYVRYIDRSAKAEEVDLLGINELDLAGGSGGDDVEGSNGAEVGISPQSTKFAMKEGEKIHIGGLARRKPTSPDAAGKPSTGLGVGLAPPPPPGSTVFLKVAPPPMLAPASGAVAIPSPAEVLGYSGGSPRAGPAEALDDDEEWGDFS